MFPERSRHSEPCRRTLVVFGAQMALGAVLNHNVDQTGGKKEARSRRADTPVDLDAVLPVPRISLKVHVSLSQFSDGSQIMDRGSPYSKTGPNTTVAFAILEIVSLYLLISILRLYGPNKSLSSVKR